MKIQIDFTMKEFRIEDKVTLNELFETVKKVLPNDEWKEFKIDTNTTILNWGNPIIIDRYPVYPQPYTHPYQPFWWQSPTYVSGATTTGVSMGNTNVTAGDSNVGTYTASNGVYNLEIKNSN